MEGAGAGTSIALGDALVIGRDPAADLCLADQLVSRRHARVRADAGGAIIEDLGSSNGTLINDVEISEPTRLAAGDRLLIGGCVIVVLSVRGDEGLVGSVVAGHRILDVVARGGMGVVYRARHERLGRVVALKVLPPELAANAGFKERFECESRLAAAIDHPNIVPLYDAGTADGLLFITMRFVEGLDLNGLLRRDGPLSLERAVSIVGQIGAALDAAHARGLVHRDVKPANVLVASGAGPESSDHCYLTDFGLTRDTSATERLTKPGEFVGTTDYSAPEQIRGDAASGAADQYALGCLLYECLTGGPPFRHAKELDVLRAHLNDDPPPVGRGDLPAGVDDVIARAMAKQPAERFASCAALTSATRALAAR